MNTLNLDNLSVYIWFPIDFDLSLSYRKSEIFELKNFRNKNFRVKIFS